MSLIALSKHGRGLRLVRHRCRRNHLGSSIEKIDWTASIGDQGGFDAQSLEKFHLIIRSTGSNGFDGVLSDGLDMFLEFGRFDVR